MKARPPKFWFSVQLVPLFVFLTFGLGCSLRLKPYGAEFLTAQDKEFGVKPIGHRRNVYLVRVEWDSTTQPSEPIVVTYDYEFDPRHNIPTKITHKKGENILSISSYEYDSEGKVVRYDKGESWHNEYTYDLEGRVTQRRQISSNVTTVNYTYLPDRVVYTFENPKYNSLSTSEINFKELTLTSRKERDGELQSESEDRVLFVSPVSEIGIPNYASGGILTQPFYYLYMSKDSEYEKLGDGRFFERNLKTGCERTAQLLKAATPRGAWYRTEVLNTRCPANETRAETGIFTTLGTWGRIRNMYHYTIVDGKRRIDKSINYEYYGPYHGYPTKIVGRTHFENGEPTSKVSTTTYSYIER